MTTNEMTTEAYGKKIRKSRQAVLDAIKKTEKGNDKRHLLPGVVDFKKLGRDYILRVLVLLLLFSPTGF